MRHFILIALLSVTWSQELPQHNPVKRSYVCPPKFIRQGHRCYYFSKEEATWQEALFHCRAKRSQLAIIKKRNQDKLIRNFLSQKTLDPVERWLGGVYDWVNSSWKWAASGKPLSYNGMVKSGKEETKEILQWHCLIMDPALEYRWSSRECVEKKHYICHTKLKIVTNKGKKKLKQHYNVDQYNKLNEIPVPSVPNYDNDSIPLKNIPITFKFEINESLNDQAMFAFAPKEEVKKVKKNRKRKAKKLRTVRLANGTVLEVPKRKKNKNKRKKYTPKTEDLGEPTLMRNIRWRTYKKEGKIMNPLYPRPIVEEYNYVKER
ncbi:hypothetical protein JTB14_022027 [Gonioctena quinquepunctata]|nr:hypothetical protein JTB14_022027 [Gonioctena quinquepunctata]